MNKRFVYFATKAAFEAATQGTEYDFTSIVFIGDSKEIWNRGILYATPNDFDINDYLKKADAATIYQPVGNYLTEHQSLDNYYTKNEVNTAIENATSNVNDNHYDKEAIDTKFADYSNTTQVNTLISNAKSEILGGAGADYDTLKEIETWINAHQDLYDALVASNATKGFVEGKIDGLANVYQPKGNYLTEHQSLAAYATTEYVNNTITGLSDTYYSKDEVDAMFEWGEY